MATGKSKELEGQVALITGAARNIGKAIALDLVDAGVKVAINVQTSVDAAEEARGEIEALGGEAMVVQADITKADEVAPSARSSRGPPSFSCGRLPRALYLPSRCRTRTAPRPLRAPR